MPKLKNDRLVEVAVDSRVEAATDQAFLADSTWFPRSLCDNVAVEGWENDSDWIEKGHVVDFVVLPAWFAEKEGLAYVELE